MISTIFFDMDGVLADFTRGSMRVHQVHVPMADVRWNWMGQVGFDGEYCDRFWGPLRNEEFWANLDPLDDGMTLFRMIEEYCGNLGHSADMHKLGILSNAGIKNSAAGKDLWLDKHLPSHKDLAHYAKAKHLSAAPCKLLIDDADKNVDLFEKHKGKTVLIPRPWNKRKSETDNEGRFDVQAVYQEILTHLTQQS